MKDVLDLCRHLPEKKLARGEILIEESIRTDRIYVLKQGAFEVLRQGVRVIEVVEPGAFLGEMSALMNSAPTATLTATQDSVVYVIEHAAEAVRTQPELTFAVAALLARRLNAVTTYLVDIKRQYAGSNTHLGLMDKVLGSLMTMNPSQTEPGSERSDVPDY